MAPEVKPFPSVELALVQLLTSKFGRDVNGYRFSTRLPGNAGITQPTFRIKRISGAARNIRVDHPVVDVDCWYTDDYKSERAALEVQAALLSLRGTQFMNGVIQSVEVNNGPRWLPDPNTSLFRYSATYEVHLHG
jgi:hypothetical protein